MIEKLFEIGLSQEEKDKLIEQIQEGIEAREYPEYVVSFEEFVQELNSTIAPTDISEYKEKMNYLSSKWDIHAFRQIKSHRKILGPIIIFYKRVARKLLKFYVEPITDDQRDFNENNVIALKYIENYMDMQEIKNTQIVELNNKNYKEQLERIKELKEEVYSLENKYENAVEKHQQEIERYIEEKEQLINQTLDSFKQFVEEKDNQIQKQIQKQIDNDNYVRKNTDRILQIEEKTNALEKILQATPLTTNKLYDKKSYAQSGEDTILSYVLNMLQIPLTEVTYIDLGANHAKEMSNTCYFYENGAKGILVEANPSLVKELKYYRHRDIILHKAISNTSGEQLEFYQLNGDGLSTLDKKNAEDCCAINDGLEITDTYTVESITVEDIIEEYLGKAPTFISIDIEGKEMEVLQSINFGKHRPKLIIVETIPYRPHIEVNIKKNEIVEYMKQQGYVEYAFTGINSIFIDTNILGVQQ